jgi:hypothetical protein
MFRARNVTVHRLRHTLAQTGPLRLVIAVWLGCAACGCGDDDSDQSRLDAGPHDTSMGVDGRRSDASVSGNAAERFDAAVGQNSASGALPPELCTGESWPGPDVRRVVAQCTQSSPGIYQCSCDDYACGGPSGIPIVPEDDAGVPIPLAPWKTRMAEEEDAGTWSSKSNEGCRRPFAAASCEEAMEMECGLHTGENGFCRVMSVPLQKFAACFGRHEGGYTCDCPNMDQLVIREESSCQDALAHACGAL